jgi:hypothetical protein
VEAPSSQEILTAILNHDEVYKDDLDVCLGCLLRNEVVQFAEFVVAFKDEQAEVVLSLKLCTVSVHNFMDPLSVWDSIPHLSGANGQQLHSER